MRIASLPENETERLAALQSLDVLDSDAEAECDALVKIAAGVCGTPISLITLIDENRQWFKANIGLPGISQTSRDAAFCAHAILGQEIMEVGDASLDPRFVGNPLVEGDPRIRFYAGAPLVLSSGYQLGTLCVIDRKPGELSPMQREALGLLANVATKLLEGRRALGAERRLSDSLQISEARFRALADSAPIGIFETDAALNRTFVNRQWMDIWGLDANDSLGSDWRHRVHPDDLTAADERFNAAVREQRAFEQHYRIVRPDGTVRHVHSKSRPLFEVDGGLKSYVGTLEDETDRVLALEALAASEEHARRLYEATPAMMHSIDGDGKLIAVSDLWLEKLGYGRDEVIGRPSTDFLTEKSKIYAKTEVLPAFFANGFCRDIHYEFICKSGAVLNISLSAILDHRPHISTGKISMAVLEDITVQHRAEQALKEAHERMTIATDSGGIGIWDWDLATGQLLRDSWTCRIFGLPDDGQSITYQSFLRSVHPDDIPAVNEAVHLAIAEDAPFDIEFRIIWDDGSLHYIRSTARVLRGSDGTALRMTGANLDVTEQRTLSQALSAQHELLRVTLDSIGDAVISTNANGDIVWLNPVAERMTGWLASEAAGKPLASVFRIINEETREPCADPVSLCMSLGHVVGLANHTVLISRDGTEYGIEDSAAPIRGRDDDMLGIVLVFHDVTEQRRLTSEMSYRATHDALTSLINRAEFESRLRRALRRAQEEACEHALIYLDLDQFKVVNDTCGHAVGDVLLQQVAKLFRDRVRESDTVARLGGDEFAILLEFCTADKAMQIARGICEAMDEFRFVHDGRRFRIGTSVGVVPIDHRWSTIAAILQAADSACYVAKDTGRNRVHLWHDSDKVIRSRLDDIHWTALIEQALDDNGFVLFAQCIEPILGLADDDPGRPSPGVIAEVLLRMRQPNGELISPGRFLGAAERFHLVSRVDRWVVVEAINWLKSTTALARIDWISINLSGHTVGDRACHRWILDQVAAAGPDIARRLCFEITETAVITNMVDAALFIEQLRSIGVKVALDDFGAGAASFGYLKKLKVDTLKIDGQFIQNLMTDALDDAAVRCFAELARVTNMKTVAEWVETPATLTRLAEIGIDFAQGFLLHQPKPLAVLFDLA